MKAKAVVIIIIVSIGFLFCAMVMYPSLIDDNDTNVNGYTYTESKDYILGLGDHIELRDRKDIVLVYTGYNGDGISTFTVLEWNGGVSYGYTIRASKTFEVHGILFDDDFRIEIKERSTSADGNIKIEVTKID